MYISFILLCLSYSECTDPTPSDGFVNPHDFSINSTVAVRCNDGFSLNGNENVTCLPNGLWTHNVTCSKLGKVCQKINCFVVVDFQCYMF